VFVQVGLRNGEDVEVYGLGLELCKLFLESEVKVRFGLWLIEA